MPISHKHKLFFVHIPKNAGTALTEHLDLSGDLGHYQFNINNVPKGYKSFCVVRNPYDRLVSCYEYARMKESYWHSHEGKSMYGPHPDYNILKDATFNECLELLSQNKLKHQGWLPQWVWIANQYGKIEIDYIIKMENLEEDFNSMLTELGHDKIDAIPKINKSKRKDFQSYYNDETLNIVRSIYNNDLKLFGYEN